MLGAKEFKAKLESDAAFRAKFAGIDSEDKLISAARAEGYDLEQISEEDLENVAGGIDGISIPDYGKKEPLSPYEKEQLEIETIKRDQKVNIYLKLIWKTIFG